MTLIGWLSIHWDWVSVRGTLESETRDSLTLERLNVWNTGIFVESELIWQSTFSLVSSAWGSGRMGRGPSGLRSGLEFCGQLCLHKSDSNPNWNETRPLIFQNRHDCLSAIQWYSWTGTGRTPTQLHSQFYYMLNFLASDDRAFFHWHNQNWISWCLEVYIRVCCTHAELINWKNIHDSCSPMNNLTFQTQIL